jgi:hypothetical protein
VKTLKAGTRCECRDADCAEETMHGVVAVSFPCMRDAVRLVTVPFPQDPTEKFTSRLVPMCQACAAFAEGGAR